MAEPIVATERIVRRHVKWHAHWPIAMSREPADAQGDGFDDTHRHSSPTPARVVAVP